jgi:hypothetical protein
MLLDYLEWSQAKRIFRLTIRKSTENAFRKLKNRSTGPDSLEWNFVRSVDGPCHPTDNRSILNFLTAEAPSGLLTNGCNDISKQYSQPVTERVVQGHHLRRPRAPASVARAAAAGCCRWGVGATAAPCVWWKHLVAGHAIVQRAAPQFSNAFAHYCNIAVGQV